MTKVCAQNVETLFKRILCFDQRSLEEFCVVLDNFLDDLNDDEFFGEEGEADPRIGLP